jgi:hypothetical protein
MPNDIAPRTDDCADHHRFRGTVRYGGAAAVETLSLKPPIQKLISTVFQKNKSAHFLNNPRPHFYFHHARRIPFPCGPSSYENPIKTNPKVSYCWAMEVNFDQRKR